MFNNINNNDYLYNSELDKQSGILKLSTFRANTNKIQNNEYKNPYIDRTEISNNALELFQKDCDIAKFNKIAISDPTDLSHIDRMNELFAEGVTDVFENDAIKSLVTNSKLWDDLDLQM